MQNQINSPTAITLLIPTHNRPKYVARCLAFYSSLAQEYEILVLDSSTDQLTQCECKKVGGIEHVPLDSNISFSRKLNIGGELATGTYIAVCADDDIIFPEGLNTCADYLDKHPDVVAAHGNYLRHWVEDSGKIGLRETYVGAFASMLDTDVSALDRLQFHFHDYIPTFYALTRRDCFITSFKATADSGVEFGLSEVLSSAMIVLSGKVARLNVLYGSRESHQHNWVTDARLQQMYCQSFISAAIEAMLELFPHHQQHNARSLFSKLLVVNQGMNKVPLSSKQIALRADTTSNLSFSYCVSDTDSAIVRSQIASLFKTNRAYNRQEMIALREALYLPSQEA